MTEKSETTIQQRYARISGLSYIVFTLAGLVSNFALNSSLSDINLIQAQGLFTNDMHFRLDIVAEIVMFLAVVMASASLYVVCKPINRQLAQTALCLRMVEIIIGGIAVVISMTLLAMANKPLLLDTLSSEQLRLLFVIASSAIVPAYEYSWVFMGFAGVITFYLLFTCRFIPRFLCIWGIVTYASMIVFPIAKILIADLPKEAVFVLFPGALFELCVGVWLLCLGINQSPKLLPTKS